GRVASFVNQSRRMSSQEAEDLVEEQAGRFEDNKDYLISIWDHKLLDEEAGNISDERAPLYL
ncbi:MAG TPA: hypothetical protein PLT30_11610, partial [Deltaproteobacteria bacterium]|nr:hypothetical protein [Deltaproteobacteria bacterium]